MREGLMALFRRHTRVAEQELPPLCWDADEAAVGLPEAIYSFGPVPISPQFDAVIRDAIAESESADVE